MGECTSISVGLSDHWTEFDPSCRLDTNLLTVVVILLVNFGQVTNDLPYSCRYVCTLVLSNFSCDGVVSVLMMMLAASGWIACIKCFDNTLRPLSLRSLF